MNRFPAFGRLEMDQLWKVLPGFVLVWMCLLHPLSLLDFWWHLKAGEIIWETWTIPRVDDFSFTATGQLFVLQNWLAEVLLYLVYWAGGFPLLVFANALLLLAAFLPVYRLGLSRGNLFSGVAAGLLLVVAYFAFGTLRPQVFSFLIFSVYYVILSRFREHQSDLLYWLPVLMILWVNLHGAFPLGLILILVFAVIEVVERTESGVLFHAFLQPRVRRLVKMFAICAAATLANPELHGVWSYVLAVAADPASRLLVAEWQPPRINSPDGLIIFFLPFFTTLALFIFGRESRKFGDFVLVLVFSALALVSLRNSIWFCIVIAPLWARWIPAVDWQALKSFFVASASPKMREGKQAEPGQAARPGVNLAIGIIVILITLARLPWVEPGLRGVAAEELLLDPKTPVGALDFIEDQRLEGRIFHPQIYGDYLIWRLWPQQRSFIDGRVHLFGLDFVEDQRAIYRDSCWEKRLEKYEIRFLLLSKATEDNRRLIDEALLAPLWRLLYEDGRSVLFARENAWEGLTVR